MHDHSPFVQFLSKSAKALDLLSSESLSLESGYRKAASSEETLMLDNQDDAGNIISLSAICESSHVKASFRFGGSENN